MCGKLSAELETPDDPAKNQYICDFFLSDGHYLIGPPSEGRMKLRVRVRGQTGRLELEEEKPTLGDLRRKLSAFFLPSLGYRCAYICYIISLFNGLCCLIKLFFFFPSDISKCDQLPPHEHGAPIQVPFLSKMLHKKLIIPQSAIT